MSAGPRSVWASAQVKLRLLRLRDAALQRRAVVLPGRSRETKGTAAQVDAQTQRPQRVSSMEPGARLDFRGLPQRHRSHRFMLRRRAKGRLPNLAAGLEGPPAAEGLAGRAGRGGL